jgi:hypothetical protein
MEVRVDEPDLGVGEDEDKAVVVAVEVGDGYDALDARPLEGDVGGGGEAGGTDKNQQQKERTEPPTAFSAGRHLLLLLL